MDLVTLADDLHQEIDKGNTCLLIVLDCSTAFYNSDHYVWDGDALQGYSQKLF